MKKVFLVLAVCGMVCCLSGVANATVLFSDDFTGTTIDSSKWTAETGYGSVSQNNEAIFTMMGNGTGNTGVHLRSSIITVPTNPGEVVFSGVWRLADSTYTAAANIYVYDAANPSRFIAVEYGTWTDTLTFADTTLGSSITSYGRGHNLTNLPFAFHFSDTGWTYEENGIVLRNVTSNFTNGVDDFYIKIGGWDASNPGSQIAYFNDINITSNIVPEPASLAFLGLGLFGFLRLRKKRV